MDQLHNFRRICGFRGDTCSCCVHYEHVHINNRGFISPHDNQSKECIVLESRIKEPDRHKCDKYIDKFEVEDE